MRNKKNTNQPPSNEAKHNNTDGKKYFLHNLHNLTDSSQPPSHYTEINLQYISSFSYSEIILFSIQFTVITRVITQKAHNHHVKSSLQTNLLSLRGLL